MSILKLLIGVLAVVVFTKIGANKSHSYEQNYRFYNALCVFCSEYISELKFSKKELKSFINKDYGSIEFSNILSQFLTSKNAKETNFPNFLNEVEVNKLFSFFDSLGKSDSESQQGVITAFLNDFTAIKNEKYSIYKKYETFYKKLGFYVGLILLIMVV